VSDYEHRSDVDEGPDMLQGDDALAAFSFLLAQTLQNEPALTRWSDVEDVVTYVEQVKNFLQGVFKGAEWPQMYVTPDMVDCPTTDGVVNVLLDAMREPVPLGDDMMTAALGCIVLTKLSDRRIVRFFEHIRHKVEEQMQRRVEEALGKAHAPTAHVPATKDSQQDVESEGEDAFAAEAAIINLGGAEVAADAGINVVTLEEFKGLDANSIQEVRESWEFFVAQSKTKQAAGEAIFVAIFESAPSLQALFTTPRAVQAMRFVSSLNGFVMALDNPRELKVLVETIGFSHLQYEVTVPRVVFFRDAILELFSMEMGTRWTDTCFEAWRELLNYMGGAIIYCKAHYNGRLHILLDSWRRVNQARDARLRAELEEKEAAQRKAMELASGEMSGAGHSGEAGNEDGSRLGKMRQAGKKMGRRFRRRSSDDGAGSHSGSNTPTGRSEEPKDGHSKDDLDGSEGENSNEVQKIVQEETKAEKKARKTMDVPTTFQEMFEFNAAVVGLRNISWHREILNSFGDIVTNVAISSRLQEECQVLALRITSCTKALKAPVNLSEFKSCMLAALRALLPKVWDSAHEIAWAWLWENVERLLRTILGLPPVWQTHLEKAMQEWGPEVRGDLCRDIYVRFFDLCPAGQDFFKQSNTRLHFIASQVLEMPLAIFKDPWGLVEEISGVGLRHVGYGIPTEQLGPFVTSWIEVFATSTEDETAVEAFRWSLGLIAKILVRTINEGSTIVMKAVNQNNPRMLRKALIAAPRGQRAEWVLNVQVGTQQISPLLWAIQSGSLEAAKAIIKDLLTIRADREKYYYGVEAIFRRHDDIVGKLVEQARSLVPTLFDGLIWRSRHTRSGLRRVNFYVQHLVNDTNGNLAEGIKSICAAQDQKMISHPVLTLVSDTLWTGVVKRQFILSKLGFLFGLFVFLMCQAILPKYTEEIPELRWVIFVGRMVNYVFSMVRLGFYHSSQFGRSYVMGDVIRVCRVPIPAYLKEAKSAANFLVILMLCCMWITEPMLFCAGNSDNWPTEECEASEPVMIYYTVFSMLAMMLQWLLLTDMAAFTTKLSAFVLVCKHVLSEVGRFLFAMVFLLVTFSSSITCLQHEKHEFRDVTAAANCLFAITVGLYEGDYREFSDTPVLLGAVFFFVTLSAILLINLLIAQLNCSYEYVYADMMGFARLTRATLIVDTLATTPTHRWTRFLATLRFDMPVEFDEGDVGLSGAIQVKEPASLNPVTIDSIIRYGGSCSEGQPWPEESSKDSDDRFERVERSMAATLKKLSTVKQSASGSGGMSGDFSGEQHMSASVEDYFSQED